MKSRRLGLLLSFAPAFLCACGESSKNAVDTGAPTNGTSAGGSAGQTSSSNGSSSNAVTGTSGSLATSVSSSSSASSSNSSSDSTSSGSGGAATTGSVAANSIGGGSSVGGDATTGSTATTAPRPPVSAEPGTDLVTVDTEVRYQSFEGWGTSLCWWANHVGGWSAAGRDRVVEAVLDPVAGLGYNIFRYNIGGGENPAHDHMEQYREMPGFQNEDGSYVWENDANQRAVLLSLQERGEDLIFEAFSNSPPYWMTVSGCASGSDNGANNLKPDSYGEFADYLTEVVMHYRDEYGVVFRTLEPLNEPYADWWQANGSQEGCHFDRESQETIIAAVAEQLTAKGLTDTAVSAADENSMDDALANLNAFSPETIAAIAQINVHSYAGSRREALNALALRHGKRLWQSESGPLGQSISDDTEAALFMAGRIIQDLRELKPVAWVDWQSGDPSRSWASFTLNDAQESFSPLKRFFMHAGFSRFIRPGSTFVDVNHPDMVAAVSADAHSLALVVLNADANQSHGYTFDLTSLPTLGATASVYRTSRDEDLEALSPVSLEGYRLVAEIPAASITTFVIPMP